MGTEHDNEYAMYIYCDDGYKKVEPIDHDEVAIETVDNSSEDSTFDIRGDGSIDWLVHIPWPARTLWGCRISRKRFIKMLMSYGLQRNSAVALAAFFHRLGISYAMALYYSKLLDLYRERSNKAKSDS